VSRRVLVVGAGGAGLAAALEAANAGIEVTVLDAAEQVGGATARAGGVVYAADTAIQKAAGVEDSVEELFAYLMTISHYRLEPRLVRTSAAGTREVVDWLSGLGVEWPPERLYPGGLETYDHRRGHMPGGDTGGLGPAGGAVIVNALLRAVRDAGVTIRTGVRAVELMRNAGAGEITGVVTADGERITADAIVLATGGFGASRELLARHYPDATAHGDWHWYIGPPENVGDGLTMGLDAGATVVNENAGVLMETPNFSRVVDAFTPPWLVFVNTRGQRFVNEMASYCVLGSVIGAQPGSRCFALFDAAALAIATEDPAFTDPYGLGVDMESNWTSEVLNAQIEKGAIHRADTLAGLAEATGIAVDGLIATVEAWNADVVAGRDVTFEKPPTMLLPVGTPPFHAVELRPAVIGMTFAGLRIDDRARVLDVAGRPISGLFAAGELTGGLMGWIYPAGGTSIGNALVFGRIAGTEAARGAR
jgi:flavocytochrome c